MMMIALVLLGLCSCKKYEEGPALSFRSAENRLCRSWKVTAIAINGTPQDNSLPSVWEFHDNNTCSRTTRDAYSQEDLTIPGTWAFGDNKTIINITWTLTYPAISLDESWTILGLRSDEVHLRASLYGNLTEYTLEP